MHCGARPWPALNHALLSALLAEPKASCAHALRRRRAPSLQRLALTALAAQCDDVGEYRELLRELREMHVELAVALADGASSAEEQPEGDHDLAPAPSKAAPAGKGYSMGYR